MSNSITKHFGNQSEGNEAGCVSPGHISHLSGNLIKAAHSNSGPPERKAAGSIHPGQSKARDLYLHKSRSFLLVEQPVKEAFDQGPQGVGHQCDEQVFGVHGVETDGIVSNGARHIRSDASNGEGEDAA